MSCVSTATEEHKPQVAQVAPRPVSPTSVSLIAMPMYRTLPSLQLPKGRRGEEHNLMNFKTEQKDQRDNDASRVLARTTS